MKKITMLFACMLSVTTALAVNTLIGRTVARNADGYYYHIVYLYPDDKPVKEFDGQTYHEVQSYAVQILNDYFGEYEYHEPYKVQGPVQYIRQDENGSVCRYNVEAGREEALTDMTLSPGEEFTHVDGVRLTVERVDEADGVKVIYLKGTDTDITDTWRSDIGSVASGLVPRDIFPGFTMLQVSFDMTQGYVAEVDNDFMKTAVYAYEPSNEMASDWLMFNAPYLGNVHCDIDNGILHVTGLYQGFENGRNYAECLIDDEKTVFLTFSKGDGGATSGKYLTQLDLHFGGFDPGKYLIYANDAVPFKSCIVYKQDVPDYRPLVQKGKTWKVGYFPEGTGSNVARQIHTYRLEGDTIIDGRKCLKLMHRTLCAEAFPLGDGSLRAEECVGALYEDNKVVYAAIPGQTVFGSHFVSLYDFRLLKNDPASAYSLSEHNYLNIVATEQESMTDATYKGNYISYKAYGKKGESEIGTWYEGVGTLTGPLSGVDVAYPQGDNYRLMQCSVFDEILYDDSTLIDGVNPDDMDGKRRIDFTHVSKPVLKSMRRAAGNTDEQVSGGYTPRQLTIDVGQLSDMYKVTIKENGGNGSYVTSVCGAKTIALDVDISSWNPSSAYTITLEGNIDRFTATFTPGDYVTGIDEVLPDAGNASSNIPTHKGIYDLQGRRLVCEPLRGIYIKDGRKVVK